MWKKVPQQQKTLIETLRETVKRAQELEEIRRDKHIGSGKAEKMLAKETKKNMQRIERLVCKAKKKLQRGARKGSDYTYVNIYSGESIFVPKWAKIVYTGVKTRLEKEGFEVIDHSNGFDSRKILADKKYYSLIIKLPLE